MSSKAKSDLLKGLLKTPEDSFLGTMVDSENKEELQDDFFLKSEEVPTEESFEKLPEEGLSDVVTTEEPTVEEPVDDFVFLKEETFNKEPENKSDNDIEKSVSLEKPSKKRGRPKMQDTKKEETQMPDNNFYDEIIKSIANNLLLEAKNSGLSVNGLDKKQIDLIWNYIIEKFNK